MKHANWDAMTKGQRAAYAQKLLLSPRGTLILSQALTVAARELRKVEHPELSNIEDMEMLRDELFPIYRMVEDAMQSTMPRISDRDIEHDNPQPQNPQAEED